MCGEVPLCSCLHVTVLSLHVDVVVMHALDVYRPIDGVIVVLSCTTIDRHGSTMCTVGADTCSIVC